MYKIDDFKVIYITELNIKKNIFIETQNFVELQGKTAQTMQENSHIAFSSVSNTLLSALQTLNRLLLASSCIYIDHSLKRH